MRQPLLIFFLLFCASISYGQSIEWTGGREFDYGDIPQGQPAIHVFQFKNDSDQPILVELVRTTCGCTVPEWSKNPINPGETGEIKVVFDAQKRGWFQKKIRVFFDGKRRGMKLIIYGEVQE